jgi:DNA-binding transcriptional regulator YdaS (Cro superfamily)
MPKTKPLKIKNSALAKAVVVFRFQRSLATEIGVHQQSVWYWLYKSGVVPAEHVLNIENATRAKGEVVTRHELRPDIYPLQEAS